MAQSPFPRLPGAALRRRRTAYGRATTSNEIKGRPREPVASRQPKAIGWPSESATRMPPWRARSIMYSARYSPPLCSRSIGICVPSVVGRDYAYLRVTLDHSEAPEAGATAAHEKAAARQDQEHTPISRRSPMGIDRPQGSHLNAFPSPPALRERGQSEAVLPQTLPYRLRAAALTIKHFRDCPPTGHIADIAKRTQMTHSGPVAWQEAVPHDRRQLTLERKLSSDNDERRREDEP